ncbi:MAG: hypothetical protein J5938_00010 [Clostridia bacterium]|nr:hypothetical protein [Clostridia bacterium]
MALFLSCVVLAAVAAVSCGEGTPQDVGETRSPSGSGAASGEPAESAAPHYDIPEPDLGELDFGGEMFGILASDVSAVYAESLIGEIVNDAIYNRNLAIEQRFNLKFRMDSSESLGFFPTVATQLLLSGDTTYTLFSDTATGFCDCLTTGAFLDMRSLPYCDFTRSYWNQYALEGTSIKGRNYFMPTDFSHKSITSAQIVYFSQKIVSENDLENPYDFVDNNTWTLDNYLTMIRQVSRDLNGDGQMDTEDQYGVLLRSGRRFGTFLQLFFASGMHYTTTDEEGARVIDVDSEKAQALVDRLSPVFLDKAVAIDFDRYREATGYDPELFFMSDRALFMHDSIDALMTIREMETDFGVLPNPKYDSSQDGYYHKASPFAQVFAVGNNADVERAGAVLEYASWLSHYTVMPAYYEVTIKQKRTRDEKALEILDIIHDSIYFDIGDLIEYVDMCTYTWKSFEQGSFARGFDTMRKKINKALDKYTRQLDSLES